MAKDLKESGSAGSRERMKRMVAKSRVEREDGQTVTKKTIHKKSGKTVDKYHSKGEKGNYKRKNTKDAAGNVIKRKKTHKTDYSKEKEKARVKKDGSIVEKSSDKSRGTSEFRGGYKVKRTGSKADKYGNVRGEVDHKIKVDDVRLKGQKKK
jgi:hypothetical protein